MKVSFAFFGTSAFSVIILEELKLAGLLPALIVTMPDSPQGRHLVLTPPPVKIWADENKVEYIQPASLKDLKLDQSFDLFMVASYGKIIPQNILDIPAHGTLNVHPSLLPRLRGPSPIAGAILNESKTGVTIMKLDAEMDHGPIVAQTEVPMAEWPPYEHDLEETLAHEGGNLLAEVMPRYIDGTLKPVEQDHAKATYTQKFLKADMAIDMSADAQDNLKKIHAFAPHAYTFFPHGDTKIRVIIKRARIENGALILERVVPEGRKEMSWDDFKRGFLR